MERDILLRGYLSSVSNFNSHAHVERDAVVETAFPVDNNFNSHAHVERDYLRCTCKKLTVISTHTLTWSVTQHLSHGHVFGQYFNSHAHVERDLLLHLVFYHKVKFQLTRSRGA